MGITYVRNKRNIGLCYVSHSGDLTQSAHAHFKHANLRGFGHIKHRKRHSYFVIVVTHGPVRKIFGSRNGIHKFLGGGLAHTSGNSYGTRLYLFFIRTSHPSESLNSIIDHEHAGSSFIIKLLGNALGNYRNRALLDSGNYKIVTVKTFTLYSDEHSSRFRFAGVCNYRGYFTVAV